MSNNKINKNLKILYNTYDIPELDIYLNNQITTFDEISNNIIKYYISFGPTFKYTPLYINGSIKDNYVNTNKFFKHYIKNNIPIHSLSLKNCLVDEKTYILISKLISLISLDVSSNCFPRYVKYLNSLKKLNTLKINNNSINYKNVLDFSHLTNLTSLIINNNRLGKGIIILTEKLLNLTELNVNFNQIEIDCVKAITKKLKKLIILDIGQNFIQNEGVLLIFDNLKKLKKLNIENNYINNLCIYDLLSKIQLDNLYINNNSIIITNIKNNDIFKLKELNIDNTFINYQHIIYISHNFINLLYLSISCNMIKEKILYIENMVNLEYLDISFNFISDKHLVYLEKLIKLKKLLLNNNNIYNIINLLTKLLNLNFLNVSCNNINKDDLKYIQNNYKNIDTTI